MFAHPLGHEFERVDFAFFFADLTHRQRRFDLARLALDRRLRNDLLDADRFGHASELMAEERDKGDHCPDSGGQKQLSLPSLRIKMNTLGAELTCCRPLADCYLDF